MINNNITCENRPSSQSQNLIHQQEINEIPRGQLKSNRQKNPSYQSHSNLNARESSEKEQTKKNNQKANTTTISSFHNFHQRTIPPRRSHAQSLIENQFLQRQVQTILRQQVQPDQTKSYVLDILKYMLAKEAKKIQRITIHQDIKAKKNSTKNLQNIDFKSYILGIHQVCVSFALQKSLFPACYFFFRIFCSKRLRNQQMQYAVVVSLLTASKYHQIYPPYLQSIHSYINESLSIKRILKEELDLLQLLNFQDFYSENELVWVQILGLLLRLKQQQMKQVKHIMRIGLLSFDIFLIRPSLKAFAAIAVHSKIFKVKYDLFYICQGILKIKDKQLQQTITHYNHCLKNIDNSRIQFDQFSNISNDSGSQAELQQIPRIQQDIKVDVVYESEIDVACRQVYLQQCRTLLEDYYDHYESQGSDQSYQT